MDGSTAIQLINELCPRPGMKHEAKWIGLGEVRITIWCDDARDSDYWPSYPRRRRVESNTDVRADMLRDMADVTRALVCAYVEHEQHECREFIRDAQGVAHLHPHRPEGVDAWERTGSVPACARSDA